jgi:nucleoside-diphosphate-sugar epimerase
VVAHGINVVVGNGFLGKAIASELSLTAPTLMLGRNPSEPLDSVTSIASADFAHSLRSLNRIKTLFWAAGPSSPFRVEQKPDLATEHISYVTNILSAVAAERIFYCSSGGTIYGNYELGMAASESHSLNPISIYGEMHMQIENFLKTLPNVTCLRISNLYGKSQHAQQQQGLISHAIRSARLGIPLDVYGTGDETRDYISIETVAKQATMLSLVKTPNVLNIGTGVATSTNQILDVISKFVGQEIQTNHHPRRSFDVEHNLLDISQLRRLGTTETKLISENLPLLLDSINLLA